MEPGNLSPLSLSLSLYKIIKRIYHTRVCCLSIDCLAEFTKLNPIGYVPVLVDGDVVLADSFAISLVNFSLPTTSTYIYMFFFFNFLLAELFLLLFT